MLPRRRGCSATGGVYLIGEAGLTMHADTIGRYPVHRHRLPSSARRSSWQLGAGRPSAAACASAVWHATAIPGVQKPLRAQQENSRGYALLIKTRAF